MIRPTLFALAVALASPGFAQEIFVPPVTTADPGYLFANDQYSRALESAPAASEEEDEEATEVKCEIGMVPDTEMALAQDEYNSRLERDGFDSAQEWVNQAAQDWYDRLIEEGVCDE